MSTQMTITGVSLVEKTPEQLMAMLNASVDETKANTYKFAKFSGKDGTYSAGQGDEQADLTRGTEMLWSIMTSNKNWICWVGNEPKDFTEQISLFETLPPESSLADHSPYDKGEGWQTQFTLHLYDPATKQEYMMKMSATSQKKAVGELIKAAQEQMSMHDIKTEVPVIKLNAKKFKAQGHQNWKPDFEIVGWVKNDGQIKQPQAQSTPKAIAEDKAELADDNMKA